MYTTNRVSSLFLNDEGRIKQRQCNHDIFVSTMAAREKSLAILTLRRTSYDYNKVKGGYGAQCPTCDLWWFVL